MSASAALTEDQVSETAPLRLADAVTIAFPHGGMTVSGLRREIKRGRLAVEVIAGKQFVTLRDIKQMRERCRDIQKAPVSGLSPKKETSREGSYAEPHGSFETERIRSALDALKQTARGLSKPSPNTSQENIKSRGTVDVIHLRS
jgi:hypothetical protein